jgi:hypothetical protein
LLLGDAYPESTADLVQSVGMEMRSGTRTPQTFENLKWKMRELVHNYLGQRDPKFAADPSSKYEQDVA